MRFNRILPRVQHLCSVNQTQVSDPRKEPLSTSSSGGFNCFSGWPLDYKVFCACPHWGLHLHSASHTSDEGRPSLQRWQSGHCEDCSGRLPAAFALIGTSTHRRISWWWWIWWQLWKRERDRKRELDQVDQLSNLSPIYKNRLYKIYSHVPVQLHFCEMSITE